jgi:hypothetical protein
MQMADQWAIFRDNLESLIEEYGSPEALAHESEVSFWTLQSWRTRAVAPQYESLAKVAKAARMTVEKLVEERIK